MMRRLGVGLHHLPPQGLMNIIHGSLKTGGPSLGKQLSTWHVPLHFHQLVFPGIILFDTQEHLARLDFPIVGEKLVKFGLDKIQQTLVSVEMNGMNLGLHGATRDYCFPVDR